MPYRGRPRTRERSDETRSGREGLSQPLTEVPDLVIPVWAIPQLHRIGHEEETSWLEHPRSLLEEALSHVGWHLCDHDTGKGTETRLAARRKSRERDREIVHAQELAGDRVCQGRGIVHIMHYPFMVSVEM